MEYPLITDMLAQLQARLQGMQSGKNSEVFASIQTAVVTSYENLFEVIPELISFPAVVLTAGNIRIQDTGISREVELAALVIDEFRASPGDVSGWNLIDRVCSCLTGDTPGQQLSIDGIHYSLESVTPLELDGNHVGWNVTLSARAAAKIEFDKK